MALGTEERKRGRPELKAVTEAESREFDRIGGLMEDHLESLRQVLRRLSSINDRMVTSLGAEDSEKDSPPRTSIVVARFDDILTDTDRIIKAIYAEICRLERL